jgi:hypothetical protein
MKISFAENDLEFQNFIQTKGWALLFWGRFELPSLQN